MVRHAEAAVSPFMHFSRDEWSQLRANTPLTLDEWDLAELRGLNESVSLMEVVDIYLPLSRLLNLYVAATKRLHQASDTFVGKQASKVPYIVGVAGSVAVGKSTTARILQALLARWPDHPRVDLVTTDGFLYPNVALNERGILPRKGFPESYDLRRLINFLAEVKSGAIEVSAPVYSHVVYDIVPDQCLTVRQPDILILEGLNVLQAGHGHNVFVSDYFDFAIYVNAREEHVKRWYVQRFLTLRERALTDPGSFFHRFASMSADESTALATQIWEEINGLNLRENIAPTRGRADLILEKGPDHSVVAVKLRRL